MTAPSLSAVLRVATLALTVTALAACASPGGGDDSRGSDSTIIVSSTRWLTGALDASDRGGYAGASGSLESNAALRPTSPWLGTIGLRSLLSDSAEVGMGMCVPDFLSGSVPPRDVDRALVLGVGVWLKFDF